MTLCPLIETYAQGVTDGSFFVEQGALGGFKFRAGMPPLRRATILKAEDGASYLHYAARLWERSETVNCVWQMGPTDQSHGEGSSPATRRSPVHFHAAFQISNTHLHVDFVRKVSYGPLMGTQMVYVFIDGRLAQRGGEFAFPPGSMRRCWPLAIRVDRRVLLVDRFFHEDSDSKFDGLSLWKRVDLSDLCPAGVDDPRRLDKLKSKLRKLLKERFPQFYHSNVHSPAHRNAAIDRIARKILKST